MVRCPNCNKAYTSQSGLDYHLYKAKKKCVPLTDSDEYSDSELFEQMAPQQQNPNLTCPICKRSFVDSRAMSDHLTKAECIKEQMQNIIDGKVDPNTKHTFTNTNNNNEINFFVFSRKQQYDIPHHIRRYYWRMAMYGLAEQYKEEPDEEEEAKMNPWPQEYVHPSELPTNW